MKYTIDDGGNYVFGEIEIIPAFEHQTIDSEYAVFFDIKKMFISGTDRSSFIEELTEVFRKYAI